MNNNKFVFPEKPQEKDYLIAYIDLLGTKDLLKNNCDSTVFNLIYHSFVFATEYVSKVEELKLDNVQIKIFSDNIIIALPIEDCCDCELVYNVYKRLTVFLTYIIYPLISKGILFRGAITLGKLQINDYMVWGKGLLDAVYLEENIAIFPRIILSENLVKIFNQSKLTEEFKQKFSCILDFDKFFYFDFFDYTEVTWMEKTLPKLTGFIEEKLKSEDRISVLQKYRWFQNYLQYVTEKFEKIKTETQNSD